MHVDMDAFFASVEQRDNPAIFGKPVVVGSDPKGGRGRGVVSTCSYEARKFGVHSAMPIAIAYHKCPHAVFLPVNMDKYVRVSALIYEIFYRFTPTVESVGVDEAFLDITQSFHLFGSPLNVCCSIKKAIKNEAKLTASVGLAPNKFLAKIASELNKPDGLAQIRNDADIKKLVWPLDIKKMWGVGEKTAQHLRSFGINTIGDLACVVPQRLKAHLGRIIFDLQALARGHDETLVESNREAKSVGNELTFDRNTFDKDEIEKALLVLSDKVSTRLRQADLKGKTISLKIRFGDFTTFTRAITISRPTNFCEDIFSNIKKLYQEFLAHLKPVRLVGVKVSGLSCHEEQLNLFTADKNERKEKVHQAIMKIRDKFGDEAIVRAKTMGR